MVRATLTTAHLACLVPIVVLALASTTAQAGVVVASTSPPDIAIALDDHGRRLRVFSATADTIATNLSPPADALYRSMDGEPLLVHGSTVWSVGTDRGSVKLAPRGKAPCGVNAAAGIGRDRWAFLAGGRWRSAELVGARLYLSNTETSGLIESQWVTAANQPQFLTGGYLRGARALLVGVRTRAVFDSALRLRPWIFSCHDGSIRPLWLGTSFSRPFVDAVFADCIPGHDDEICVTELTRRGRRQVLVYSMHGRLVEGAAASVPGRFGSRLRTASRPAEDGDMLCTWVGGARGQIVALAATEGDQRHPGQMCTVLQTDHMDRPAAWDIAYSGGKLQAFVLHAGAQQLRIYGFR